MEVNSPYLFQLFLKSLVVDHSLVIPCLDTQLSYCHFVTVLERLARSPKNGVHSQISFYLWLSMPICSIGGDERATM